MSLNALNAKRFMPGSHDDGRVGRVVTLVPRDPQVSRRRSVIVVGVGVDAVSHGPVLASVDGRVWDLGPLGWKVVE